VRGLRPGDRVTVCGEVGEGTLKLEKFALREAVTTERVVPACPDCERSMESAGREQGYRCRDCGTTAPGRVGRDVDRRLDPGWYEVPPCARRHVAKPLVRGGFDAPTHPER
jgi:tRNA(Ile2)-agmatinylcytidine synthase